MKILGIQFNKKDYYFIAGIIVVSAFLGIGIGTLITKPKQTETNTISSTETTNTTISNSSNSTGTKPNEDKNIFQRVFNKDSNNDSEPNPPEPSDNPNDTVAENPSTPSSDNTNGQSPPSSPSSPSSYTPPSSNTPSPPSNPTTTPPSDNSSIPSSQDPANDGSSNNDPSGNDDSQNSNDNTTGQLNKPYVNLSPSTSNFNGDFSINLNLNSGTSEVIAVDVRINYSGPVQFLSGTSGGASCEPNYIFNSNSIDLICFFPIDSSFSGYDTISQLHFRPTGNGNMTITIEDIGGNLNGTGSGNYSISQ